MNQDVLNLDQSKRSSNSTVLNLSRNIEFYYTRKGFHTHILEIYLMQPYLYKESQSVST